ncbi:MAG: hypothetical protein NVS9B10_08030 [Nevskia sp.]
MNLVRTAVIIACVASLSACAANRRCARPQAYENAPSIPPLVGTDTLKVPVTSTALKVPEAKGESLTFGYVTPDPARPGKTKVECLDLPPPIPPLAEGAK